MAPDQLQQAPACYGRASSSGGVSRAMRDGSGGGAAEGPLGSGLRDGPLGPLAGLPPAVLERLLSGGEDAPDP
jgi:hypothetical protein